MSKKNKGGANPPSESVGGESTLPEENERESDIIGEGEEGEGEPASMLPWEDAGMGEEMQAAEGEARRSVVQLAERKAKGEELAEEIRAMEPNLVKRAKALAQNNFVVFKEVKTVRNGDAIQIQAVSTDTNRIAVFEALFGSGDDRPHIDTFRGRLVDHRGEIVDDRYSMIDILHALHEAGLKTQSIELIKKCFKEWGLSIQRNDLIRQFESKLPDWDGKRRAQSKLIRLFECYDSDLNRMFGHYFWLSIYCRVMYPGCMAPIALSLFGPQDAGKSYFSKLICRTITGDPKADAVQLDLAGDSLEFLRKITGASIVANVGEMTGFTTTDLNKIKSFMTLTSDKLHYKFEGHFDQQRQWIVIMDGNKYEGLQRDATGNRRFYPMFVGQLPDKDGQPAWRDSFSADFTGFAEEVWQIMAECRRWLDDNDGLEGYHKFVGKVSKQVAEFNMGEMNANRGTPRDQALDNHLVEALLTCERVVLDRRVNKGTWVSTGKIGVRIKEISRGVTIMDNRLKVRMLSLGAIECQIDRIKGYLFEGVFDDKEYCDIVSGRKLEGRDEEVKPDLVIEKKRAKTDDSF